MRGTRLRLMLVVTLPYYLFLHGDDEKDKNNADFGSSSSLLLIVARA